MRDVFVPGICRTCDRARIVVPPNKFDILLYSFPLLMALELKSTKEGKSIPFDNKIIKEHQIKYLKEYTKYKNLITGFVFNFAKYNNKTYFLFIDDFIKFKESTTRSSIPLDYCAEVGIEIENTIKKVNYKYYLQKFIEEIKNKYDIVA
jgi:penicillin-binding protein-related factor A (putative recombinase)